MLHWACCLIVNTASRFAGQTLRITLVQAIVIRTNRYTLRAGSQNPGMIGVRTLYALWIGLQNAGVPRAGLTLHVASQNVLVLRADWRWCRWHESNRYRWQRYRHTDGD